MQRLYNTTQEKTRKIITLFARNLVEGEKYTALDIITRVNNLIIANCKRSEYSSGSPVSIGELVRSGVLLYARDEDGAPKRFKINTEWLKANDVDPFIEIDMEIDVESWTDISHELIDTNTILKLYVQVVNDYNRDNPKKDVTTSEYLRCLDKVADIISGKAPTYIETDEEIII